METVCNGLSSQRAELRLPTTPWHKCHEESPDSEHGHGEAQDDGSGPTLSEAFRGRRQRADFSIFFFATVGTYFYSHAVAEF